MKNKSFIIAEIGLSHEGSLGFAKSFIDESSNAGADAVKFQMHIPNSESTKYEKFRKKNIFIQDKSRFDYWKRTSFTKKNWNIIKSHCKKKKIKFICSPFSLDAVKYLKTLNIDYWKIASGEFNNRLLLDEIIKKNNKKIIMSNGLTFEKEIDDTIKYLKSKKQEIILLECNSEYPSKIEHAGHNLMKYFKKKYAIETGLSDHTGSLNSLIAALSFDADYLEAHVVFDKKMFGPDTSSSIDFKELEFLCKYRDDLFKIKNSKKKKIFLNKKQIKMKKIFTKSIFAKKTLQKGHKIKISDIIDRKPLIGLSAKNYREIIGKLTKKKIKKDTPIKFNLIRN